MIVGRCNNCNFVARYNSNYYSIEELTRHVKSESITEEGMCIHELQFQEDQN